MRLVPMVPVECAKGRQLEQGNEDFKTVNNNLLDLNRCFHFIVFPHILSQLMFHQPCGEKAAIFIRLHSRPTTIFFRENRHQKRFRYLVKIQKGMEAWVQDPGKD